MWSRQEYTLWSVPYGNLEIAVAIKFVAWFHNQQSLFNSSNNYYAINIVHGHCSSMLYKLQVLSYLICAVPCLAQAPYFTISNIKYLTEGPYKKELAHTVLASDIWQDISPRRDENTDSTMMCFGNMEEWTLNTVKTEC